MLFSTAGSYLGHIHQILTFGPEDHIVVGVGRRPLALRWSEGEACYVGVYTGRRYLLIQPS